MKKILVDGQVYIVLDEEYKDGRFYYYVDGEPEPFNDEDNDIMEL